MEALGIGDDVLFAGWVDEAHKPALYRGAACAVFPSRYEGFGLPVLEALACGTPLMTSNTSSLPELVGDAGFALDPDDTDGLAGAMLACLVDEPLAAELRVAGRSRPPVQLGANGPRDAGCLRAGQQLRRALAHARLDAVQGLHRRRLPEKAGGAGPLALTWT